MFSRQTVMLLVNMSSVMMVTRKVQRAVTLWMSSVGHKVTWGHWDAQDSKGSYNPRPRTTLDVLSKGETRLGTPNSPSPP